MKKIFWLCVLLLSTQTVSIAQKKQKGFSQKKHEKALLHNYKAIVAMADNKFCGNPNDFAFVPFGTNPCGGPKEYLIYSKNVDRKQFFKLVEQYNIAEAAYNKKYNIKGICTVPPEPTNIKCEQNKPVFVY